MHFCRLLDQSDVFRQDRHSYDFCIYSLDLWNYCFGPCYLSQTQVIFFYLDKSPLSKWLGQTQIWVKDTKFKQANLQIKRRHINCLDLFYFELCHNTQNIWNSDTIWFHLVQSSWHNLNRFLNLNYLRIMMNGCSYLVIQSKIILHRNEFFSSDLAIFYI